jgi:hypothetical protein
MGQLLAPGGSFMANVKWLGKGRGKRNIYCPHYDACLNFAIASGWRRWHCEHCPQKNTQQHDEEDLDPYALVLLALFDPVAYREARKQGQAEGLKKQKAPGTAPEGLD